MNEDGETIYFLIKSKSDEYCFTNKALVKISEITRDNQVLLNYTNESIRTATTLMSSNRMENINPKKTLKILMNMYLNG